MEGAWNLKDLKNKTGACPLTTFDFGPDLFTFTSLNQDMKRFSVLLVLLSTVIPVNAQEADIMVTRNEISINLFTVKNKQVVDGGPSFYPYFFQGIHYKRKIEDHIIRVTLGYYQRVDELKTSQMNSFGNFVEVDLGVGYQRHFFKKKIQPYLAGDILLQGSRHDKENETPEEDFYEKYEIRVIGFGIAPTLGLRARVSNVLSFSLETSVQLILNKESGTLFRWEPNILPVYADLNTTRLNTFFNPISALLITLEF